VYKRQHTNGVPKGTRADILRGRMPAADNFSTHWVPSSGLPTIPPVHITVALRDGNPLSPSQS